MGAQVSGRRVHVLALQPGDRCYVSRNLGRAIAFVHAVRQIHATRFAVTWLFLDGAKIQRFYAGNMDLPSRFFEVLDEPDPLGPTEEA